MTARSDPYGPATMAARPRGCLAAGVVAQRRCPECLGGFEPLQRNQLFCSEAHKRACNRRWAKRGAVLAPLYAAARATRLGTRGGETERDIGRRAASDANMLTQRWKEEDEAAGRMSAVAYLAARYRLGLVEVVR